MPLFREAVIGNISKSSKKMAEVSVRLYKELDDLIYVSKDKNRRSVIGYTNPDNGLFVVDTKSVEDSIKHEPYKMFRDEATKYAQKEIDKRISELIKLRNEDTTKYDTLYKPIDVIEKELSDYITDKQSFYVDIQKQVDVLVSKSLPHVNEWMIYSDDVIDKVVTEVVPYKNPMKQTLTGEQKALVDGFLDVFVDEYNKDVLSWYFGAILLNIPIYDDRVSKALIVSSSNGGSGKSTLINSIANGVVTRPYRVIDSGFDKHFRANDKFSTSDLPTCRLGIYSEAYFNADTGEKVPHDFTGLDQSEMKSWITEGYVANEKKYAEKQIAKLSGMQIILTNHPPLIPSDREDLGRRFLGLIVKPSNMVRDKSKELGLRTEKALYSFVEDNAQAFANYFVSSFNENPNRYQSVVYNTTEYTSDIQESQIEYLDTKEVADNELKSQDAIVLLTTLCKKNDIPYADFIATLNKAKHTKINEIRWEDDTLYISSTKSFFIANKILELRDLLKPLVGQPIKKYNQRMFALPI